MAYLLTHFWPGATEEQYRATVAGIHPGDGLPPGQLFHAAGPSDGGILIAVLWESKEQADRFVTETLLPKMPPDGLAGRPEERTAETINVASA